MGSNLPTDSPGNSSNAAPNAAPPPPPWLRVQGLSKRYIRGGLWRGRVPVAALTCADFEIPCGQTLALVGESGSGKSTVARCVTRLERPDSGSILIGGTDIAQLRSRDLAPFRADVQMVFQDAVTSMNPRFSALEVIEEPLLVDRQNHRSPGESRPGESTLRESTAGERRDLVRALMFEVGLSAAWMNRSILHFSGGQRQRVALARALALRP